MISSCGGKDRERERSLIHLSHSLSGNSKRERNKEESFVGQTEREREREGRMRRRSELINVPDSFQPRIYFARQIGN